MAGAGEVAAQRLVIAHVLSSFGMGGQERVALDLARAQVRAGHEVHAISLAKEPHGPLAEEFREAGARVVAIAKGPRVDVGLVPRLAAYFLLERVRVVHTHNPQPLFYGAPAARLARVKIVHSKHGVNPDRGRKLLARRAAARLTHAYIAVSPLTAEAARAAREVGEARLKVVDNGVDLSRFPGREGAVRAAVRRELGVSESALVVWTVGRLAPEKDQALLLRAMAPLCAGETYVVIAGGGPEEAALRALVAGLPNGEKLRLLGVRKDVPRLLAAFDVFALTSKSEGLPLVLPEAMAMELPVVATAVGGVPNVVREGETGSLVAAGDEMGLREVLQGLLGDGARREKMGRRARELALAQYSAERMARDYLTIYRDVLAGR